METKMKFTISKEAFLKELNKIQGVGEKRQTMLILANVLINAKNNEISLLATNIEVGVNAKTEAAVLEEGSTTVNAKNLYDIVKELPEGVVECSLENNHLKIQCLKTKFNIPTLPSSDFPEVPAPSKKTNIKIKSSCFKNLIDKVFFCSSNDETKYHLNSIYIDQGQEDNKIRFVATDGHRLAIAEDTVCSLTDFGASKGILLPKKGVHEFRKLLDEAEEVSLLLEANYLFIMSKNTTVFMKEMDLDFPDYIRVIPQNNDKNVVFEKDVFIKSLKRVSLISSNIKSKTVLMSLSNNSVVLSSRSPDFGEASEEIEMTYDYEPLDIRFNSKYLMDIFLTSTENFINIKFNDSLSPILLKPEKNDIIYVIMPMRL